MNLYKISLFPIITFMLIGIILLLLPLSDLEGFITHLPLAIFLILCSVILITYSAYLLRHRRYGNCFYWDEDGVVIDLKGNKLYWHEIKDIKYYKSSVTHMRSTVIYTHYTYHETINTRHKKFMPRTAHSVDWFLLTQSKEYHNNVMKAWTKKKEEKTFN